MISTVDELRARLAEVRSASPAARVALISTIGSLHDGHIDLVHRAREVADVVVVSIFVNPLRFATSAEFDRYPRTPEDDAALLESLGVDVIFAPATAELLPDGSATTKISGLQVPNVIDGHWALTECRATGGTGHAVSDELVWDTQRRLAIDEGIFTEPAGAAALAGALQAARAGKLRSEAHIACLVTGTGFKDEASVTRMLGDVTAPMLDIHDLASME